MLQHLHIVKPPHTTTHRITALDPVPRLTGSSGHSFHINRTHHVTYWKSHPAVGDLVLFVPLQRLQQKLEALLCFSFVFVLFKLSQPLGALGEMVDH